MLFFSRKLKLTIYASFWQVFLDCVIREILGSVLKPPFLCKCCSAIRREEVCKQVGCDRERLTLYINNTNFPLINMQQLKHIIFQDLLNEPRIMGPQKTHTCTCSEKRCKHLGQRLLMKLIGYGCIFIHLSSSHVVIKQVIVQEIWITRRHFE